MAIPSPPGGNRTRVHSCSVALNLCSLSSDFVGWVLSVPVSWLCEEWFAVGLLHRASPESLSVGWVNWSGLATLLGDLSERFATLLRRVLCRSHTCAIRTQPNVTLGMSFAMVSGERLAISARA